MGRPEDVAATVASPDSGETGSVTCANLPGPSGPSAVLYDEFLPDSR